MRTRHLLTAGIVAGPLFVTVVALQLATRDGFDLTHHPISLLTLGDAGWVQVANFVVAASCPGRSPSGCPGCWCPVPATAGRRGCSGCTASGWSSAASSGRTRRSATRSAPRTRCPTRSPGTAGCTRWPRRWPSPPWSPPPWSSPGATGSSGVAGWARYSAATAAAALLVTAWPHPDSISWRLAIGVVVGFAWLTALAVRERAPSCRR